VEPDVAVSGPSGCVPTREEDGNGSVVETEPEGAEPGWSLVGEWFKRLRWVYGTCFGSFFRSYFLAKVSGVRVSCPWSVWTT